MHNKLSKNGITKITSITLYAFVFLFFTKHSISYANILSIDEFLGKWMPDDCPANKFCEFCEKLSADVLKVQMEVINKQFGNEINEFDLEEKLSNARKNAERSKIDCLSKFKSQFYKFTKNDDGSYTFSQLENNKIIADAKVDSLVASSQKIILSINQVSQQKSDVVLILISKLENDIAEICIIQALREQVTSEEHINFLRKAIVDEDTNKLNVANCVRIKKID